MDASRRNSAGLVREDVKLPRRAHLVGAGGNGMRALAEVLAQWDWALSGSDISAEAVSAMRNIPGRWFEGHAAENVPIETQLVIYTDAMPRDNPELRRAAELGVPALRYFEMLGRISAGSHTVAVAGTHGKSTTTSMAAHILIEAGRDPTVVCGAAPLGKSTGGRAGRNDLWLIEACEYRANFLRLHPRCAAILNIEPDHFDCYDSLDALEAAFRQFAERLPDEGYLLIRHDCPSTRRIAQGLGCRIETFGCDAGADWSAVVGDECSKEMAPFLLKQKGGRSPATEFEIRHLGKPFCEVRMSMPGRHNVLNALAAAALAWENGASVDQIAAGLESYPGLRRRMERLGDWRGVSLIDDYAHHPTEVRAALATVRDLFPQRRVWCVFQPHQVSRTARLLDELAESLQNADRVLVAEIYRAREGDPRPGDVTATDLAQKTASLGVDVLPVHSDGEIVRALESGMRAGDVLITLGAGDVRRLQPWNKEKFYESDCRF